VVTNKIVTTRTPALPAAEVVNFPKVFNARLVDEVAPMTSAFICHQRHPISDPTKTAPQVYLLQDFICEERTDFADKIPTNSLAVGTFKYNFVSPSASVLNPAGGHFGDGDGVSQIIFFFAGAFFFTGAFLTGAFLVTLAFGVGVGLVVAAVAGAIVIVKPMAISSANFLDLIISVDPI
jgi:hypothetical protein